MTYRIDKVAVIGAGTMGGGIAAHLANIGIPVVLLDIATPNLSDEEKDDPEARSRLVKSLYERMAKAKPANLASKARAELITVGNMDDDFDLVADADWVVEVIIERLDLKQELMERLEATCKPDTIISSNTSGIPINEIAEGRSGNFKKHFLGTHFFNPPRYLKLLELIPTPDTDPEVTQFMADAFGLTPSRWIYGLPGLFFAQLLAFTPIAFLVLIGVVEGVTAIYRESVELQGDAGHCGTTPMASRKDALCAASERDTPMLFGKAGLRSSRTFDTGNQPW